jgi:hypothetical protein
MTNLFSLADLERHYGKLSPAQPSARRDAIARSGFPEGPNDTKMDAWAPS